MPKAKLRKESMGMPVAESDEKHYPTSNIPATKEIVSTFTVGDDVVVMLKGKVKSLSSSEYDGRSHADFTMEVHELEAYSEEDNEYEKMSHEDEAEED